MATIEFEKGSKSRNRCYSKQLHVGRGTGWRAGKKRFAQIRPFLGGLLSAFFKSGLFSRYLLGIWTMSCRLLAIVILWPMCKIIGATKAPMVQIKTRDACYLSAAQVSRTLSELPTEKPAPFVDMSKVVLDEFPY